MKPNKYIVLFLLLIVFMLVVGIVDTHGLENPFPVDPVVEEKEGDDELVEVPLGTLRNALLVGKLYDEAVPYIDFLIEEVVEPQDEQISLLIKRLEQGERRLGLLTVLAVGGASVAGVLGILLIIK